MHKKPWRLLAISLLVGFLFSGCASQKYNVPELVENSELTDTGEPSHITVQHILIGFRGSVQGKDVRRTRVEAALLAKELLTRAGSGENFGMLVEKYTDDSPPGIYHLANIGQPSDMDPSREATDNVFARNGMVPAFGDVGFPLEIGEVGMAPYDRRTSPYGWHIIKRLR